MLLTITEDELRMRAFHFCLLLRIGVHACACITTAVKHLERRFSGILTEHCTLVECLLCHLVFWFWIQLGRYKSLLFNSAV